VNGARQEGREGGEGGKKEAKAVKEEKATTTEELQLPLAGGPTAQYCRPQNQALLPSQRERFIIPTKPVWLRHPDVAQPSRPPSSRHQFTLPPDRPCSPWSAFPPYGPINQPRPTLASPPQSQPPFKANRVNHLAAIRRLQPPQRDQAWKQGHQHHQFSRCATHSE